MDKQEVNTNVQGEDPKCLFSRIGGDGQISDMIDQFYYKVLFDKTLRPFFYKADMSRVRLQQKIYFSTHMFGAQSQKYEGRDIPELHKNLGITNRHFDSFKKHLETILVDMDKPKELIDEILSACESQRNLIVFEKREDQLENNAEKQQAIEVAEQKQEIQEQDVQEQEN